MAWRRDENLISPKLKVKKSVLLWNLSGWELWSWYSAKSISPDLVYNSKGLQESLEFYIQKDFVSQIVGFQFRLTNFGISIISLKTFARISIIYGIRAGRFKTDVFYRHVLCIDTSVLAHVRYVYLDDKFMFEKMFSRTSVSQSRQYLTKTGELHPWAEGPSPII